MPITISVYTIEDLYTPEEAMEIIGVGKDAIGKAVSTGILTSTHLKPYGNTKFLLRTEVDALAGLKQTTSREARARIAAVHNNSPRDYVAEEQNYGAPLPKYEEHSVEQVIQHAYSRDPGTFMSYLAKLLGGHIRVEYDNHQSARSQS